MSIRFCPNPQCGSEINDDRLTKCPICHTALGKGQGDDDELPTVRVTDGGAVNHLNQNVVRNHNSDSHDVYDSHDVTSHVNHIYIGKTADEMSLAERKKEYRKRFIDLRSNGNGIIDKQARGILRELAESLSLSLEETKSIERNAAETTNNANTLSASNRNILNLSQQLIKHWEGQGDESLLKQLQVITRNVDDEEANFYYNLLLVQSKPSRLATDYEQNDIDEYWQTFWAAVAYTRLDKIEKATETLIKLENFKEAEGNRNLLVIYTLLYDYFAKNGSPHKFEQAKNLFEDSSYKSRFLEPFATAINYLLSDNSRPACLSNSQECNFYLSLLEIEKKSPQIAPVKPITEPIAQRSTTNPTYNVTNNYDNSRNNNVGTQRQGNALQTNNYVQGNTEVAPPKRSIIRYVILVIVVVAAIIFFKNGCTSDDSDKDMKATIETTESPITDSPVTNPGKDGGNKPGDGNNQGGVGTQPIKIKTGGNGSNNAPDKNGSDKKSKPGEEIKSEPIVEPEPTQEPPKPKSIDEMSGSELYQEGAKLVRSFKHAEAIQYLEKAAQKGSAKANTALGEIYLNGNGVNKNFSKAFEYFSKSANMGDPIGMKNLSNMYYKGYGCDKDKNLGDKWDEKAKQAGF